MLDNLKIWWNTLADRERRLLMIGGIFVGVFMIYSLIWSPLSTAVTDNAIQVKTQRALLLYMQKASDTIKQLQSEGVNAVTANPADLMSTIEQNLSQHQLSSFLKQVAQPQQDQIALTFENVPFDQLMQSLQELTATQGVHVLSLSADRLAVAGTANVKTVLSSSEAKA